MKCVFLVAIAILALTACKEQHEAEADFEPGEITDTSKAFKIPKELKNMIDDEYVAFMKTQGPPFDILKKEELLLQVPREFMDIEVMFTPLSAGTLTHPTKIKAMRGGGIIDMKDFVKGAKGSFFFDHTVVKTSDQKTEPAKVKIFYLSEARKRKIGDETFGAGCNKFMDVTSYLVGLRGKGVQVNATDQRYVSVLAGIYYFIGFDKEKLYLSALKIEDSRYPRLQCEI